MLHDCKAFIYLVICRPTTPRTPGPEWKPFLICTSFPIPFILSKDRPQIISAWLVVLIRTPKLHLLKWEVTWNTLADKSIGCCESNLYKTLCFIYIDMLTFFLRYEAYIHDMRQILPGCSQTILAAAKGLSWRAL